MLCRDAELRNAATPAQLVGQSNGPQAELARVADDPAFQRAWDLMLVGRATPRVAMPLTLTLQHLASTAGGAAGQGAVAGALAPMYEEWLATLKLWADSEKSLTGVINALQSGE